MSDIAERNCLSVARYIYYRRHFHREKRGVTNIEGKGPWLILFHGFIISRHYYKLSVSAQLSMLTLVTNVLLGRIGRLSFILLLTQFNSKFRPAKVC